MDVRRMYDSEYLAAWDLDGDVTVEIERVEAGTVGHGPKKDKKPLVYFVSAKKALILNKTNLKTIGTLYGYDAKAWTGKRITLYAGKTSFGNEVKDAIRVRPEAPKAATAEAQK